MLILGGIGREGSGILASDASRNAASWTMLSGAGKMEGRDRKTGSLEIHIGKEPR
jgi:hypothetical protein